MSRIKYTNYVADFETTVYEGQTETEVWASAIIPLEAETSPENVTVENNIDSFMNMLFDDPGNKKVYFHNLKFDGSFILPWLFGHGFKVWSHGEGANERLGDSKRLYVMPAKHFITMIGDMGQWYSITIRYKHKYVTFVDSLKLLPFSVDAIGKGFETRYRKLSIEYEGERHAHGIITKEETDYIKNDVLVMHEALNKLFEMTGEERLTIGSLCLSEFYKLAFHDKQEREAFLPDLSKVFCPIDGFNNADEYVRKSYKGAWCLVKAGCENRIYKNGCTADVNSLYPSMMHSDSGNVYPYGKPTWFTGEIPAEVIEKSKAGRCYYFVRVRTMFHVKQNKLPCIQIKHNPLYPPRKWLDSSDINGVPVYKDIDGNIQPAVVTMTLTQTDLQLIRDHYELTDFEVLDGCYFPAIKGLFDDYINKWATIKKTHKGAIRTLAKLFLNNLYGKLASSTDSSYKIPFMEDGILKNKIVIEHNKQAGYIPMGSAITSYARNFTIRHAQKNYKHFLYADTDSIHCDCSPSDLVDIEIHPTDFNHWSIENEWDKAIFVRAKTYIEHNVICDGEEVNPFYMVKCAGMTKSAKETFINRLEAGTMTMADFKVGLIVPNNLKAKQIKGGTVLQSTDYVMHARSY